MMVNVETGAPGASILNLGQLRAGSGCVVWLGFQKPPGKKKGPGRAISAVECVL